MAEILGITLERPDPLQARRAVADTLVEGATTSQWFRRQSRTFVEGVMGQVRQGLQDGLTSAQVAKNLQQTVYPAARSRANTIAATSFNAVSARARMDTIEANTDVVKAVQQVSTLDNRTSDICIAYSGMAWRVPSMKPYSSKTTLPFNGGPPRHFNCRSTLVPVLKSMKELGLDDFGIEIPTGTRASMDGQVPADLTFDAFLRGKSAKFADDLLGPARAKLWREKKITLNQLVDMRGNPLSLEELEEIAARPTRVERRKPPTRKPPETKPAEKPRKKNRFDVTREDQNPDVNRAMRATFGALRRADSAEAQEMARTLTRDRLAGLTTGKGAHYQPRDREIQMFDAKARSKDHWEGVFAHEYGHFIDNMISVRNPGLGIRFASTSLDKARQADGRKLRKQSRDNIDADEHTDLRFSRRTSTAGNRKKYVESLGLRYDKILAELGEDMGLTPETAEELLFDIAVAVERQDAGALVNAFGRKQSQSRRVHRAWINIADYFGAMTKNRIGFGHSKSYYSGPFGGEFQGTEMFANYYATRALYPGLADVIRKLSPEWSKGADELIADYSKAGAN
jgi:SPP1 gp7 family putative phage head morphogenesis protein